MGLAGRWDFLWRLMELERAGAIKRKQGKRKPLSAAQKARMRAAAKYRKQRIERENFEQAVRNQKMDDYGRMFDVMYFGVSAGKEEREMTPEMLKKYTLIKRRTPAWADIERIKAIYFERNELNKRYGPGAYHVDHVIPLNGKNVSGLHVHENLRIITAFENMSKGNRFDEN